MRVHSTGLLLWICGECEATWRNEKSINGKAFEDFGTLMEYLGLEPLWSELEPQQP